MKISIRDFAPIKKADIALDGLTVIAGDNDTGKSTVGKLVYSFTKSCVKSDGEILWRSSGFTRLLNILFPGGKRSGSLSYGDNSCQVGPAQGGLGVTLYEGEEGHPVDFSDVLMIESPLMWQLFDTFQGIAAQSYQTGIVDNPTSITAPYTYFDVYSRLNGSVKYSQVGTTTHLRSIEKTIDGKIIFANNSPKFQRGDETFPMESVATGIQAFGFMQRILELGLVRPGFLLILDEPEVHLHPKWQLQYAKLLVSMVEKYDMSVLLTTHSPVFVETLDFVGRKRLGDKCKFYLSERDDEGGVVMRNVSKDLEPIYEKLAHPLMQLSLFQGDA